MKLNLTKEQESKTKEILRAMASRKKSEAWEAQEILAAFLGATIDQVLDQSALSSLIFNTFSYDRDSDPSIPLDLFDGNTEGLIQVWSQTLAGGLMTNHVSGTEDFRFTTESLDTAVSCGKKYAQNARLDVVNAMINKMVQELLLKSEYLNWASLLGALATSRSGPGGLAQVYAGDGSGIFKPADLNNLWTKIARLRTSWAGGTPTSKPGKGLTHLLISPEVEGDIRSYSYNPVNTTAVPDTAESTVLGLPDNIREDIWKSGGLPSIFGVQFIRLNEMGVAQPYNYLFDDAYTPAGSEPTFNAATQEIVVGVDASVNAFLRIVENGDGGATEIQPDDQWVRRSEKIGWYARRTEGRVILDSKAIVSVVI